MNLEKYQDAVQFLCVSQSIIDDLRMNSHQVMSERVFLLTIKAELAILQYDPSFDIFFEQSFSLAKKTGKPIRWAVFYWRYLMSAGSASEISSTT